MVPVSMPLLDAKAARCSAKGYPIISERAISISLLSSPSSCDKMKGHPIIGIWEGEKEEILVASLGGARVSQLTLSRTQPPATRHITFIPFSVFKCSVHS